MTDSMRGPLTGICRFRSAWPGDAGLFSVTALVCGLMRLGPALLVLHTGHAAVGAEACCTYVVEKNLEFGEIEAGTGHDTVSVGDDFRRGVIRVEGPPGTKVTLSIASAGALNSAGGATMAVSDPTVSPAGAVLIPDSGLVRFFIGGRVFVGDGQGSGDYQGNFVLTDLARSGPVETFLVPSDAKVVQRVYVNKLRDIDLGEVEVGVSDMVVVPPGDASSGAFEVRGEPGHSVQISISSTDLANVNSSGTIGFTPVLGTIPSTFPQSGILLINVGGTFQFSSSVQPGIYSGGVNLVAGY